MAPGGFTVLELLAVLSILVLLAAVRFPAFGHTRNRSQDLIDFYNNRQLMAAANMYAADQNDTLPGCGWGTASDSWAYAKNIPTYGFANGANFPSYYSNQLNFCRQGQLFPYIKDEKTFLCPIDRPNNLYYQRSIYVTSYTWNGAVCGYGMLVAPNGPGSYKIARFKPNAILQWEPDETTPFFFNDGSSFPDEGLSGRHGNGATVGLMSGGIQRIATKLWYTPSYAGTSGQRGAGIAIAQLPNQLWCNPGVPDGLQN